MGRKVFISFLGTGNYKECIYTFDEKHSRVVKFVQEAIIQLFNIDEIENHLYHFFLTDEANSTHGDELENLLSKYPKLNYQLDKDVPAGLSEKEIWTIFKLVFEKIHTNDELYLDITHGFRSLPMLVLTLLNYAKSLRNVKVGGIYYGAFEVLGKSYEIEKNFPNPEDRKVPVLNLTPFSELQDWSIASKVFATSGDAHLLSHLLEQNKRFDLASGILDYSNSIKTTRLKDIIEGKMASRVSDDIKAILKEKDLLPMLDSILKNTENHFNSYKENEVENGIIAIDWCLKHGLIHQAYALMSEYLITHVANLLNIDYFDRLNRDTINSGLSMNNYNNFEYSLDSEEKQRGILHSLSNLPNIKKLRERSKSINLENRNDILHAGMRPNPKSPNNLIEEANEKFEKLKKVTNPCS